MVVQGKTSIWDIDVFRPLIAAGRARSRVRVTAKPSATDVSLRIIAEHSRAMAFIITDGVRPSNNERGYVLRRIIRRAVLHAYLLGARDLVLPDMVDAAIDVMGDGVSRARREPRDRSRRWSSAKSRRSARRCSAASTCSARSSSAAT